MAFEKACPKEWQLSRNTFFREKNQNILRGRDLGEQNFFFDETFFSGSLYQKGQRRLNREWRLNREGLVSS